MTRSNSATLLSAWLALLSAPALLAQETPPRAPAPEELIQLSPFTVNTSRDLGYQAENTLAGSRLNAKLRDTPGSLSVFTKEFLDDLGINDVRELLEYTVNSELDTASRVPGSGQNAFIGAANLNGNMITRGLTASQGLDYFTSITPADSYRVGRYDDSRGPNSILFGIGSPGGIINQSSKLAVTHRDTTTLRYTLGSWDRSRGEFDANRVLRQNQLAISLAAVQQENGGWRNFDFQDKKRIFGAVVFRPLPQLTFNVSAETGRDINAVMRSLTDSEEMLAWYDNRAARGPEAVTLTPNNVAPTAAQRALGITALNGSRSGQNHRVTYVENSATIFDAIGTYLTGTYNNSAVRAPDGTSGVTGGTLKISDLNLYPTFNNAGGPGMARYQDLFNVTVTADWQLIKALFLNLGHNYQRTNATLNLMTGADPTLRGEANRTLGIGGPANPYAGQLYFDGTWQRDTHSSDHRETRASLFYTLDSKSKWLGTHRLVGLLSHSVENDERVNSWLVLAGHPFNATPNNVNNRVTVRNYLTEGDYGTYRVGDWRALPATITFAGKTYGTTYANVPGGSASNSGGIQNTDSRLGVAQSHFLDGRLVTTFGYRVDQAKLIQLGYTNDPERGEVVDRDPAKQQGSYFTGRTNTAGAVFHLFDWVSLIANRSTSVGVPSISATVFPDGRLAGAPRGRGTDYGLAFDLLQNRLNFKVVHFTASELGKTGAAGSFRNRNGRIMDAFAGVLVGTGRPLSASQWDPIYSAYTPPVSSSLSDFDSSGYEARLTANLTPNWRLVANYSYSDSVRAGVYDEMAPWYGLKTSAGRFTQGVSQNASGQFVIDPGAYAAGGAVAKWIELGTLSPGANPAVLSTSASVSVAQEVFNLVDEMNQAKEDQEKRWGVRPHRVNLFTAYDFKTGFLQGFSLGGGWRWRSANVIGTDAGGRELTGRALAFADLMLRYTRKFEGLPGRCSFQINVSNLFDNADIIPMRLLTTDTAYILPNGHGAAYSRYDLVDPRDIRFSTTYSF